MLILMYLSHIVLIHLYFFDYLVVSVVNYSCCNFFGLFSNYLICCYGFIIILLAMLISSLPIV